jgi:putative NADH-flavin reductase
MEQSTIKTVILGATGFVGSPLLNEARRSGHRITALAVEQANWKGDNYVDCMEQGCG